MKIRLLAALAFAVLVPVAARAQGDPKPAEPAVDPVGKYTVSAVVQGQAADFDMTVEKKEDGSFTGSLANPNFGTSVISSLKVEGRKLTLVLATPQGVEAVMELTLAADNSIDGNWSMQGDGGKVTGKKSS
ncbi:MAG: hypothetical protein ACYC3L_10030 [Gemmatimonadaceae bacterium]